ncbi:hypothetical protein BD779DRAFT_1672945 [Infundibulicybe gibba]|nr:hypothetical protein BD779DRAFT_1672945 [Infundibulicybe gibba]
MLDPQSLQRLEHLRIVNNLDIISLTILIYDYVLNFSQELTLVWNAPWNITKTLFILTRYLPFIDMSLTVTYQFAPLFGREACFGVYQTTIWMFMAGIGIADGILALRTWAIWGHTRGLTITLVVIYSIFAVAEFLTMGLFVKSMEVIPPPAGIPTWISPACLVTGNTRIIVVNWAVLMAYEAVILGIILSRGYQIFALYGNLHLFSVVRRDGIFYYCYMFVLSFLNIVFVLMQSADFIFLFAVLEWVIHSVLTGHIIFHIRSEADSQGSSIELTDIRHSG